MPSRSSLAANLSDIVDFLGRSSLHLAAMSGNLGIVDLLLNNAISTNIADEDGNTPLHLAIRF
jgi:ankyrin repeat protein